MKQHRLTALLAVMVALLALRWWDPDASGAATDVAQAVERAGASPSAHASGEKPSDASSAITAAKADGGSPAVLSEMRALITSSMRNYPVSIQTGAATLNVMR